MTFAAPRRFGIAAFALGLLPAVVLAQTEPTAKAGRTWTDPPVREAAGPQAETSKPTEPANAKPADKPASEAAAQAATAQTATPRIAAAPASRAAASRPARATGTASVHPPRRTKVAARPAVGPRMTAAPRMPAAPRMRGPGQDPAFRVVTVRPASHAAPPVIRYGYVVEAAPARPMAYEDLRAARIRQAEEAGYLVVRSRSVEFPDGRRLRTYRPLDEDADD